MEQKKMVENQSNSAEKQVCLESKITLDRVTNLNAKHILLYFPVSKQRLLGNLVL